MVKTNYEAFKKVLFLPKKYYYCRNYNTVLHKVIRHLGLSYFILFILSSCSYQNKNTLFKTSRPLKSKKPIEIFGSQTSDTIAYRHRIKPGNRIYIRFLNNFDIGQAAGQSATAESVKEVSIEKGYLVNYDSTVTLPLIGQVNVVGKTRLEAARYLEKKYAEWGIINPIIDVNILSLSVTVLGEVGLPGKILIDKENTTLIDAIAMAGGISLSGKKNNIKIIRGNQIIMVNLKLIDPLNSPDIILQDNDLIYVEPFATKARLDPVGSATNGIMMLITVAQAFFISVQLITLLSQ